MRSAIIGVGSLGIVTGALISKAGEDCTLIVRNEANLHALNTKGATITGLYDATIPVKAVKPQDATGIFDVIFVLTKQMDMISALKSIKKNIGPDTVVVTLQNGLPEDKVAEMIGPDHVIGGSVFHGAKYIGPGISELTTEFDAMHIYLGELNGEITERVKNIARILSYASKVSVVDNILNIKYTKLVMNSALSGMSAALGCTFGEALENKSSMQCMASISLEGAKIMQAKGLVPIEMEHFLPTVERFTFNNQSELQRVEKDLRALIEVSYNEIASMLQDIQAGKTKCEIDDINGKLVSDGRELGIPTPFCGTVVDIVNKILLKELAPSFDNLKYFTIPALEEK